MPTQFLGHSRAGVAAGDPSEFAVALGLLEFVRERGECGDAASLVAGTDGQGCGEHRLAGRGRVGVRTTHVADVLPERVRLVDAPGELRDVELEALRWRTEEGETVRWGLCGFSAPARSA
jgi:hypothetical protein